MWGEGEVGWKKRGWGVACGGEGGDGVKEETLGSCVYVGGGGVKEERSFM